MKAQKTNSDEEMDESGRARSEGHWNRVTGNEIGMVEGE